MNLFSDALARCALLVQRAAAILQSAGGRMDSNMFSKLWTETYPGDPLSKEQVRAPADVPPSFARGADMPFLRRLRRRSRRSCGTAVSSTWRILRTQT